MRRTLFDSDHEAFRQTLRTFIDNEVTPHYDEWFEAGLVPREFYYKLAELGLSLKDSPAGFDPSALDSYSDDFGDQY